MELLTGTDAEISSRFTTAPKTNGSKSPRHQSVFGLFQHSDRDAGLAFMERLERGYGGNFDVCKDLDEELQQLLFIRGDISGFLSVLDPEWGGQGTRDRMPSRVRDQWNSANIEKTKLLAVGTVVANLYPKDGSESGAAMWLKGEAMPVEGTDRDAEACTAAFTEWVETRESTLATIFTDAEPIQPAPRSDIATMLQIHRNVIVEGVAGSGKTHLLTHLRNEYRGRTTVLVFHPSTSYEDFVVGLRPVGAEFEAVPGSFIWMCERATRDPNNDYLLFIDEINRANTARVLGDLLMVIESSKRAGPDPKSEQRTGVAEEFWAWKPSGFQSVLTDEELADRDLVDCVQLQTPLGSSPNLRKHLVVPRNLHILGTMNTTDRSVGTIDLALRRRFHWITARVLTGDALRAELGTQRAALLGAVIDWHERTNGVLANLVGPDARLGHSYFFADHVDAAHTAQALLYQLTEIAHTFNVGVATIDRLFDEPAIQLPDRLVLEQVGRGLGRRFQVARGTVNASS